MAISVDIIYGLVPDKNFRMMIAPTVFSVRRVNKLIKFLSSIAHIFLRIIRLIR